MNKCKLKICNEPAVKRQLCRGHYQRWAKNGDGFDKTPILKRTDHITRFKIKLNKPNKNGCINWNGWLNDDGYGKFSVNKTYMLAHRFSYEYYCSKIPASKLVLHKCDNRKCVNPDHLYVGTQKDNVRDAFNRSRISRKGKLNSRAILKEKDVLNIKRYLKDGATCASLARKFKVSESCIHCIKHKRSWTWMEK